MSPTGSDFVVVSTNDTAPPDAALAPIHALHDYFDANRAAILAAHASQVAQAQTSKSHPTATPKNTVINYWPIKSQVYGGAQNQKENAQ